MISECTVQITDNKIMMDVCGINHKNLKVLEKIADVYVSGGAEEIVLKGKDADKIKTLLEQLINIAQAGGNIYAGLIEVMYHQVCSNSDVDYEDVMKSSINIAKVHKTFQPRTPMQGKLIQALSDYDVIFSYGPAGTGKTFLSVCYAVNALLNKEAAKLILTRPVVEAGESLGFLPGDYTQKINPYLTPLFDAINRILTPEIYAKLNAKNMIEVAPLAYMRGRTFENCIVILDEAQNATCRQMKMFLTRLGENAKLIINGDVTQIDLPYKVKSGMVEALEVLQDVPEIGIVEFKESDVVRHPVVKKIINAYKKHEK
ncbi:MAG: PhoH family protein [Spirochaetales bacterium]|nr:PhoH family protein [Spirochaetales bacterium]